MQGLLGAVTVKVLTISPADKRTHTQGEIINRISTDASKVYEMGAKVGEIFRFPVMMVIALISLNKLKGLDL